jgi:YD repeat-containing protein
VRVLTVLAVIAALVVVPGSGSAIDAGATECSVDFRANNANLDCSVSMPGGRLTLDGVPILNTTVRGGQVATFTYDSLGRLVRSSVDGEATSYAYDTSGRLETLVSPDGATTPYSYDSLGRLVRAGSAAFVYSDVGLVGVTEPGEIIDYTYDSRGSLLGATQDNTSTRFAYDSRRRVTHAETPDGSTSYEYADNDLRQRDVNGEVTRFSYDRPGRLVRADGPSETSSYEYDTDGSLLRAVDGTGSTRLTYERRGLVTGISAPDDTVTSFAYDAAGQLIAVAPELGDEVIVAFLEGDPDQPIVTGMVYGDSLGHSFTLTLRGRLLTCNVCP